MDLECVFAIAKQLYALCEKVKANKKQCRRLAWRVKGLEELLLKIRRKEAAGEISDEVETALKELKITLESAKESVEKYTSATFLARMLKVNNRGDEFVSLNERLNDAFQVLSLNLQVDMDHNLHKLFDVAFRQKEDETDREEDHSELQKMLQHMMDQQDAMLEKQDAMSEKQDAALEKHDAMLEKQDESQEMLKKIGNMLYNLSITAKDSREIKDIREIKPEELIFISKAPVMKTDMSELYKGEYQKFTVAIKHYPASTSPSEVRRIFNREIRTMRHFESPNILRMFGICVQNEHGPSPTFLIITEYCEKGSLRKVLDSKRKLPWDRKARMCLDAALGIYRLHQEEQVKSTKTYVHGSLNSNKFLVDEDFRVKLGGLELVQTETSLRRSRNPKKSSLRYRSPEQLESVNHPYCKICEIYSLGMVLWEIATRKNPLDDCTTHMEIHKRVCEDKQVLEPLPDDCPEQLGGLINACRAYDASQRPTAGVLVDQLRKVVEQVVKDLEEEE